MKTIIKEKIKASVLIINFNNSKYINKCLTSLKNQTYKNFEIIFVDDKSTDNSILTLKKFIKKNKKLRINLITSKQKTKFGSFNQINCIKLGLEKCNGKYIFFLDSDDFYLKNKIYEVINFFKLNKKILITYDLPFKLIKGKKIKFRIKKRNKIFIPWPSFPSQSCIVVRKDYLNKIIKKLSLTKYPNVWFDFRLICKAFYDYNNIKFIDKYLTVYRQNIRGESIKFKKFNIKWWNRRGEAHNFMKQVVLQHKKKNNFSFDYFITRFVNFLIPNEK
tara:strand:+ start:92 stop:919 length:828 start_codon:yes stop_codon:yes gene_type:complete